MVPDSLDISPGERVAITIVIKPDFDHSNASAPKTEDVSYSIQPVIKSNTADLIQEPWIINGRFKRLWSIKGKTDFGERSVASQPYKADNIVVNFTDPVHFSSVSCDDANIVTKAVKNPKSASSLEIELDWHREMPVGVRHFTIKLLSKSVQGHALPEIAIPCQIAIVQDIQLSPSRVFLKSKTGGTFDEAICTAFSIAGKNFSLSGEISLPDGCGVKAEVTQPTVLRIRQTAVRTATVTPLVAKIIVESNGKKFDLPLEIVVEGSRS